MFRVAVWMMLIGIALTGVGCGGEATSPSDEQGSPAPGASSERGSGEEAVSADDVKREVKEAADAVKALAGDKLSQFKKQALEWQKGLDAETKELREKADTADEEGKRWREISGVLAEKRAVVKTKLRALESGSSDTWDKAKQEADEAMADLRAYLAEQTKKLSEELAEAGHEGHDHGEGGHDHDGHDHGDGDHDHDGHEHGDEDTEGS